MEKPVYRITVDPDLMLGKTVIRGTRITVELILRRLGEGASEADLLDANPGLSQASIHAALVYAADALEALRLQDPLPDARLRGLLNRYWLGASRRLPRRRRPGRRGGRSRCSIRARM